MTIEDDTPSTAEQVAEAAALLENIAASGELSEGETAGLWRTIPIVRAALAATTVTEYREVEPDGFAGDATTETHTEYRATGQAPDVEGRHNTCTTREMVEAGTWAASWRTRWADVRIESRQVTTTRTETPWTEQQT